MKRLLAVLLICLPVQAQEVYREAGSLELCHPPGDPDRVCSTAILMVPEAYAPPEGATPPPPAGAAVVQTATGNYGATSITFASDPVPGNTVIVYGHHRSTVTGAVSLPGWTVTEQNYDQGDTSARRGMFIAHKEATGSERTVNFGWGASAQSFGMEISGAVVDVIATSGNLSLPDGPAGAALFIIGLKKDGDDPVSPSYGWPAGAVERLNANGSTFQMAVGAAFDGAYDGSVPALTAPAATASMSARVVLQ